MSVLRVYLSLAFAIVAIYAVFSIATDGWNFFPILFENLAALGWSGHFNIDFLTYLWLSAIWIAWRHEFSAAGIGLALIGSIAGMLFFAPYLLVVSFRSGGDIKALLLGEGRV